MAALQTQQHTMADVLGPGGVIAKMLPGYESRPQQVEMAERVAACIAAKRHGIVEGGTGVGKSLAYLIPAIYSGKRTVVSTGNKSLQDQLFHKDLPFLRSALPVPFTAAVLKGRSNYLCLWHWGEEVAVQGMMGRSYDAATVEAWLRRTETGDLEELDAPIASEFHAAITCAADACLGRRCAYYTDCYAEKAKAKAQSANIVIVNHTLLTLDAAIRAGTDGYGSAVPDRDIVIVDEAHRLEEAATQAFQSEISMAGIGRLLRDKHVRVDAVRLADAQGCAERLFSTLERLSTKQSYPITMPPDSVAREVENLAVKLKSVAVEMERRNNEPGIVHDIIAKHVDRVRHYADVINTIFYPDKNAIVYVAKEMTRRGRQAVYLRRCPISVADDLRDSLFDLTPVISTSATLATRGGFDYYKSRVGCDDAAELIVGSPFDYKTNALLYLPPDGALFDPSRYYVEGSIEYFDRLAAEIEGLLLASDGRAFCLFTSNRALGEVYDRVAHRLRWLVLRQGDAPRAEILRRFKENGHAVLFATKSFWEGVDVTGDALSLVVIDKTPFGQPDDPVYEARCKAIGNDWFFELALPNAIITYKQGFGRLIRTKQDRGVVALMDGRITLKPYGRSIVRSLPRAAITRSIEAVKTFFDTGSSGEPVQGSLL